MKILKKLTEPLQKQLLQGVSAEKLAQSVASGLVLGTIPLLGSTTALCLIAASLFRLNHIAIQTINYVAYPLQLALLIPFLRLGEWMFSAEPIPLNVKFILSEFNLDFSLALKKYLTTGLMGICAWLIIAPFAWGIFYLILKKTFLHFSLKVGKSKVL